LVNLLWEQFCKKPSFNALAACLSGEAHAWLRRSAQTHASIFGL
jgi:hypothetical protein